MTTVALDLGKLKFLHCGLGQFCRRLGEAVLQQAPEGMEPAFLLPPQQRDLFPASGWRPLWTSPWRRAPWGRWLGAMSGCDLWHSTYQDSRYSPPAGTPTVLTVHDLNFLFEGKSAGSVARRMRRLQSQVDRACAIATGSHFAAGQIREHLRLNGKEIRVIYHGAGGLDASRSVAKPPEFLAWEKDSRPFFFTIGDITAKKNFHVLAEMMQHFPDHRLVIAGRDRSDYAVSLRQRGESCSWRDRIVLPGQIDDDERLWLYQNCQAFLFPSLAEGFGLPVLEAMSLGKPAFLSQRTSLPEVGGSLAFYWESFDADAMAGVVQDGLQAFSTDPQYSEKLRQWSGEFTWERAAKEHWKLYQEVLESFGQQRRAA